MSSDGAMRMEEEDKLPFRWMDGWQDGRLQINVYPRAFEVDHDQQRDEERLRGKTEKKKERGM